MNRQKIIVLSILALIVIGLIIANVRAAKALKRAKKVDEFQSDLNKILLEATNRESGQAMSVPPQGQPAPQPVPAQPAAPSTTQAPAQ